MLLAQVHIVPVRVNSTTPADDGLLLISISNANCGVIESIGFLTNVCEEPGTKMSVLYRQGKLQHLTIDILASSSDHITSLRAPIHCLGPGIVVRHLAYWTCPRSCHRLDLGIA